MSKLRLFLLILLVGIFGSLLKHSVYAAGPSGLTVSPAFQQVSIPADAKSQPASFTITNDKPTPQTLNLSVADFNTLSESGGLFFVGTNPTSLQKKYGLAKWVSLPEKQITIQPGQKMTIKADLLNLPDLASGGHYGALMLAIAGDKDSNSNVALHPIASSLLFVTKLGGDTHKLTLSNVYISRTLFKLPRSVTLRFYNNGNTHVIPRGIVTIKSPTNKLISKGIINEDSGIILPQAYRQYSVPLSSLSGVSIPGRYKLEVDYRFDGAPLPRAYQSSFLLLPIWQAATILLTIILIVIISVILIKKILKNYYRKSH